MMLQAAQPASRRRMTWRGLLTTAALSDIAVLLYLTFATADTLALALALALAAGLLLLRWRGGTLGLILLALVFADTAFWTVIGAAANFANREALSTLLLPSFLAVVSLVGLAAAAASYLGRRHGTAGPAEGSPGALRLGAAGLAALALVVVAALAAQGGPSQVAAQTEIVVETHQMAFTPQSLSAEQQQITVRLVNSDLWWHTFTIDELGVDLRVAMGAERSITFDAPPGEYQYYCAIPGHTLIGMRGTLRVAP